MKETGGLLVPTFRGQPWPHKPPLAMWLQAASLALPVPLETAVRLPSALALVAAAWFTCRAARTLLARGVVAVAALALLASPLAFAQGAAAATDALLLAASAAARAVLSELFRRGPSPRLTLALAAAMAAGLLAKGPPGLVLPLLSALPPAVLLPRGERAPTLRALGPPRRSAGAALLLSSAAAPLLVFTLVATKLPNYAVPALPALCVAAAAGICASVRPSRAGLGLYAAGTLVWTGGLGAAAALAPLPGLRALALRLLAITLLSAGAGVALHLRGRRLAAAGACVAGFVALLGLAGASVLPALEPLRPVKAIGELARGAGAPVAAFGFEEPSLDVYAGPGTIESLPCDRAVVAWARRPGRGVLVTTAGDARRLGLDGEARLGNLGRAEGWDVARGRRVSLVALERGR